MRIVHGLILVVLMGMMGCHPKALRTAPADGPNAENSSPMKESPRSSPNAGGSETCFGAKTIRGKLYHTKGRMGEVAGYILSPQFLTGGEGNWKAEYEALVGKEVEVQGVHYQYKCGPIEQCLEGGVINYLREIVYLKGV